MRGEKEWRCFERIKKEMFYEDQTPILDLDGYTAFDKDEVSFLKEATWYCNPDFNKNYFGLLGEERREFANIIRTANPNPSESEFPDFIFKNGFIEHFQITSSRSTRKGATHTRKRSDFQRQMKEEADTLKEAWNKVPCLDKIRSKSWTFQNPEHSHSFLIDSFKCNWEHHLESLKKYSGKKEIGIFLIEYPEVALEMCEAIYEDWINGMSQGDLRDQQSFKEFRLSRDKVLLEYMYDFKDEIKYVIFQNSVRCEVVRTENIPYLLRLMPWDFFIYPLQVSSTSTISCITVEVPETVENEKEIL